MDNIIEYININEGGLGLTNQIGYIITGIMVGILNRKKYIVISKFRSQYNNEKTVPISEIIDLDKISKNFNVTVIDVTYFNFKLISIKYGVYDNSIDITDVINENIPKSLELNNLKGDPAPNIVKNLFVTYEINGVRDSSIYSENRTDDLNFTLNNFKYKTFRWISTYNIDLYNKILTNIKFNDKFYDLAKKFMQPFEKLNIVHLRKEEDALMFWSKKNSMSINMFENKLHEKYIELFDKYIKKEDLTIILTSNQKSCRTINYLINNGYNIKLTDKYFDDQRELNAIVDLLISEYCNNVFIGGINPINYHGSTFSYLIWKRLSSDVKKILFDLDNINQEEFVLTY